MATQVAVNDVYTLLKDYSRNQSLDPTRAIRYINSATDVVFAQMGIPSQEHEYDFNFDETIQAYKLPVDYIEPIYLRYANDVLNRRGNPFQWRPAEYLFDRFNYTDRSTRLFGHDSSSGVWRLYVLGKNSKAAMEIDSFDYNNSLIWVASNDASNIRDDYNVYLEGSGSMAFDIDTTTNGRATLKNSTLSGASWYDYAGVGYFDVDLYLPNVTNFTSVSFTWGTDTGDYWTASVDTQSDGSAFVVGWNSLQWAWATATQVGSPDQTNINYIQFDLDYTANTYTGGVDYRLDYLRLAVLDPMILTYYTAYKGTDSTGATPKVDFTATTDLFTFPVFDISIRNCIALYAAVMLDPSLIVDNTEFKTQYQFWANTLGKRYPRKRINNLVGNPTVSRGSR